MVRVALSCLLMVGLATWTYAEESAQKFGLKKGNPEIKSAGALAFGPPGILFVGDAQQAAIFAIDTGDTQGNADAAKPEVAALNEKIGGMLGVSGKEVLINDLVANPASGNLYVSVSRGRGPDAQAAIVRVDGQGELTEVSLKDVPFAKAELPNAPKPGGEGRLNLRAQAITDLGYMDGRLFVSGLSNEEFASNLRSISFPFKTVDGGASIEIFHGAHGKYETRSPIRTFLMQQIEGEPQLLAAYTCTPLVKLPVADLKAGAKVKGTTIAELGNRNSPLDMVAYEKDGKNYLLIANTSRGVMKVGADKIDEIQGITEPVKDKAGLSYETLDAWQGVTQLDLLNSRNAVVLRTDATGNANLETVPLP